MTMSLSASPCSQRPSAIKNPSARGLRALRGLGLLCGLFTLGACDAAQPGASSPSTATTAAAPVQPEESRMWMTVGERRFSITLADTEAARAFAALLPLTLDMQDLNANEKKYDLPNALPTDTIQPGTIHTGDLLLWGSRTVVVFYETFNSPYSYTRLGRLDNASGLPQALGRGDVRVKFSKD